MKNSTIRPCLVFAAILTCIATSPARAEQCRASVNGDEVVIEADNFATFAETVNRRERLMNWPSRTWNRAWGTPVACDSAVLFDYLATTVPNDDIEGYCLTETDENGYFLIPGERNFRGMCRKTFCEQVNTTKEQGLNVAAAIAGRVANNAREAGLSAIKHGSGAMILSGSASSVSASLGSAGSTVAGALSTPTALAAAGVTVVAVGGAVYMCSGAETQAAPQPAAAGAQITEDQIENDTGAVPSDTDIPDAGDQPPLQDQATPAKEIPAE